VYFAERDEGVWSFVDSFWFALMTLTTVGYDLNPHTMLGKVTGGFCALLGIFILTLPIPIVVNSFASYYKNRLWRNEVAMKKKERMSLGQEERSRMSKIPLAADPKKHIAKQEFEMT
jgi:potassium voltage-gated channel Shal-related subfamily D protein 2